MKLSSNYIVQWVKAGCLICLIASLLPEGVSSILYDNDRVEEIVKSRSSVCYELPNDSWISFGLVASLGGIKIVSNACIQDAELKQGGLSYSYDIEYRIIDNTGSQCGGGVFSVKSISVNYINDKTSVAEPAQSINVEGLIPLSSRVSLVNSSDIVDKAITISVRLHRSDLKVKRVFIRVYKNEKPAQYKLRYLWQRMPTDAKVRLARGNVHSEDMVSDIERLNMLNNRWVAIAPQGISGLQYHEANIYSLKDRATAELTKDINPQGCVIGFGKVGRIPIPMGASCLRLELKVMDRGDPSCEVYVYGVERKSNAFTVYKLNVVSSAASFELDDMDGAIELECDRQVIARMYAQVLENECELSQAIVTIDAAVASDRSKVTYRLYSEDVSGSVFRCDVRATADTPTVSKYTSTELKYEMYGNNLQLMCSGVLRIDGKESLYDSVAGSAISSYLCDTNRFLWHTAPGKCTITFTCTGDQVAISCYTRPCELKRSVVVPEDYLEYEGIQTDEKEWFSIRPENFDELLKSESYIKLKVQQRKVSLVEPTRQQYCNTETCSPLGARQSLRIATRARVKLGYNEADSSAGYVALMSGIPRDVMFSSVSERDRSQCMYINSKPETVGNVVCEVDGRIVFRGVHAGGTRKVDLGEIQDGWHSVTYCGGLGIAAYVGKAWLPKDELFTVRHVYPVSNGAIKFNISKRSISSELVTLRLFWNSCLGVRETVDVEIKGACRSECSWSQQWTFNRTAFKVLPVMDQGAFVVDGSNVQLAESDECFVVLGDDLIPGIYSVELYCRSYNGMYVMCTHQYSECETARTINIDSYQAVSK